MQNASYQNARLSVRPHKTDIPKETLPRFILKGCAYAVYSLMVVIDGLNNPESFQSRFLTLPYLIGGLALVRSFCDALNHHYDLHAGVFALGISTLGALA